ncbi:hypothetical protein Zmor_002251 [Zophobas morio]|uniref:Uncharacterized protein n=1 Tax=Zophobas morio TaxID=2755281 RepID=A0AA38J431_9CUCU|nr:hypothetical protein Zmor_002251 [Zophobas morio]
MESNKTRQREHKGKNSDIAARRTSAKTRSAASKLIYFCANDGLAAQFDVKCRRKITSASAFVDHLIITVPNYAIIIIASDTILQRKSN